MGFRDSAAVEVPATCANVGPGYDCLGLALELGDTLEATTTAAGLQIEVSGEGADAVPRDDSHLVVRSMVAAFALMEVPVPGLRLACTNRVPHSRGLGSSSAAIVGGIVLARALVDDGAERLDDLAALELATRIEGHPDNVGPALLGGFVIGGTSEGGVWVHRREVDPAVRAVALVPPHGLSTEVARGLLPATVPHADAAANTARAALLVAALTDAPHHLHRATEDFLHQRQRGPAMPDSLALVGRLRAQGHAALVSGAGPTVLVLGTDDLADLADVASQVPEGWTVLPQRVGGAGARVRPAS